MRRTRLMKVMAFRLLTLQRKSIKQALSTLATLTALPPLQSEQPSYYTPNFPLSKYDAHTVKLRHQSWLPHFLTGTWQGALWWEEKGRRVPWEAVKVIDLLQHAAELGNTDALYTLGQISLFPPNSYFPSDPALGLQSLSAHASVSGNASSQALLGFFYSTGYHSVAPIDQAKAQLYLTFAAHGNHKGAQMAFRLSTLQSKLWLSSYQDHQEAEHSLYHHRDFSDLVGGVYGPGASVASNWPECCPSSNQNCECACCWRTWEDLLEYYLRAYDYWSVSMLIAERQILAYRLGKIFYQGSIYAAPGGIASGGDGASNVPRDFRRAQYYFRSIARQVWPRDPANPRQPQPQTKEEGSAQVGTDVSSWGGCEQDPVMAKMWFERGAEYGEKECHNGLGIIWRDGLVDGHKDIKKALAHFGVAATQELAEAQVHLGKYHYGRGDLKLATTYFETALRQGSPFEAYYYLADIQSRQARNAALPPNIAGSSCAVAVSFYKLVAERGTWNEDLLKDAERLWNTGTERGSEMAMLRWWVAAERGFEVAQNNLAYVLDQGEAWMNTLDFIIANRSPSSDKSILRFTRFAPISPSNDTARLALTQWTRSAAQRNVDALVKVGDYYYHGLGVPDEPEAVRWEKAAGYYQSAADTQMSALAMWNLGWMYENGVGVPQDFHLAKRHYDLAYEANSEAYLPPMAYFMGGTNGLSLWDSNDESSRSYYAEPEAREIDGSQEQDTGAEQSTTEESAEGTDYDDGPWYLGKARDEFNRRRRGQDVERLGQEDDPVQWARDKRHAENDRDNDFGPEDYFDAATRGGRHREDEEVDEFAETMLLVLLCLMISGLLYLRGRWVERMRREQQQQQQQDGPQQPPPPAGGVFPPPGDPARDDWAILR
ncbi:Protein sel-1 1 [Grifola frondosa]|uniref:Protein sel-1 1 n=1 Tax=Grifola frondosa TaxID=5627 RepID=A0A1C7LYE6_GRIFR|nr:Protein sel-1 1 [Grifola frondosa]